MIATLFIWCYASLLAVGFGLLADTLLGRLFRQRSSLGLLPTAMFGGALLSSLLTLYALMSPMTSVSHLIAVGLAGVGFATSRRGQVLVAEWHKHWRMLLLASVAVAMAIPLVLGLAVSYPDHYDSGLYHAQSIRWIDEYPAVPGLGNLHARLAFNSSWHVLESFFGFSFHDPGGFRALNGLILLAVVATGLASLVAIARGEVVPSRLVQAAMVPVALFYFQRHIASPLTDTPATLLTWLLWVAVLRRLERGTASGIDRESVAMALIGIFLVTVKLSAAPVLLVASVALGLPWRWERGDAMRLAVLGALFALPWIARSVVLSGTLAFPVPMIGTVPVDWAIPRESIEAEEMITKAWARWPGRDAAEVMALRPEEWIPVWWSTQPFPEQMMIIALGIGAVIWPLRLLVTRGSMAVIPLPRAFPALLLAGYAGVVFWFTSAPDIRFGLGSLIPLVLLVLVPLAMAIDRCLPNSIPVAAVLAVLIPTLNHLGSGAEPLSRLDWLVSPAGYYQASVRLNTSLGFPALLTAPGTDQCWNASLPCTPRLHPGLILRGCTLTSGFRISSDVGRDRPSDCTPYSSVQGRSRGPDFLPVVGIEQVTMRRRNQMAGPDIDCDTERQHEIRVRLHNRGAPTADTAVEILMDEAVLERQSIPSLGRDEERWVESSVTPRPRRGNHVLQVRALSEGVHVDAERTIEVRCS